MGDWRALSDLENLSRRLCTVAHVLGVFASKCRIDYGMFKVVYFLELTVVQM